MIKVQKPRIALYGGSFDPPHTGHVAAAHRVLEILPVDKLIVMPAWCNPFKSSTVAPADKRMAWLKRLFADEARIVVSDLEIKAARKVPTIETVEMLREAYDPYYLIIGADNLASVERWHRFEALNRSVVWVVLGRGELPPPLPSALERVCYIPMRHEASSTAIREGDMRYVPPLLRDEIRSFYNLKE